MKTTYREFPHSIPNAPYCLWPKSRYAGHKEGGNATQAKYRDFCLQTLIGESLADLERDRLEVLQYILYHPNCRRYDIELECHMNRYEVSRILQYLRGAGKILGGRRYSVNKAAITDSDIGLLKEGVKVPVEEAI